MAYQHAEYTEDDVFEATRPRWAAYQERSTPWPDDPKERADLIAERAAIAAERFELSKRITNPSKRRVWMRTFERDMT